MGCIIKFKAVKDLDELPDWRRMRSMANRRTKTEFLGGSQEGWGGFVGID